MKVCPICGAEFSSAFPFQKFCSKRCKIRNGYKTETARRRRQREECAAEFAAAAPHRARQDVTLAHQCARLMSNELICRARQKPEGVSDVRWRIELRRRESPEYFAAAGTVCI